MNDSLVEILESIEGNGSFSNFGVQSFVIPGLRVANHGEVGLPLTESEASKLKTFARKASFGKGTSTVLDTSVRSVWEIDAKELSFNNAKWSKCLDKMIEISREGFSVKYGKVEASLYKLLIYEEGDFFLPHRDSEKEQGMFATLVVGLPSKHSGGEFIVKHGHIEHIYDFSSNDYLYALPFVSFYADCEHEVKPVTSGYRVCLVYNLLLKETDKNYSVPNFTKQVNDLAHNLKQLKMPDLNKPAVILLSHQYTPSNFSLDSLKYHDRPRADALFKACELAGYNACLGLVTYYQMGELAGVEYGCHRYNYSDDESDGEMGEVYEESLYIEHWSTTTTPGLGRLDITNDNLLSKTNWEDEEPIEKFEEGYTGNAGMTMEYFYHQGAIILWNKDRELDILKECKMKIQVNWLGYYNRLAIDTSDVSYKDKSKNLFHFIASNSLDDDYYASMNYNAIVEALILLNDAGSLKKAFASLLFPLFAKIDADLWIDLIKIYTPLEFPVFFKKVRMEGGDLAVAHYLDVLCRLSLYNTGDAEYDTLILSELKELPQAIKTERKGQKDKEAQIRIAYLTLCLSKNNKDKLWYDSVLEAFAQKATRKYLNGILCKALIQYLDGGTETPGILALQLKQFCIANLKVRIANKPIPPSTWTRPVPVKTTKHEEWERLSAFMASPVESVYEYRKNQTYRDQLESLIKNSSFDLTCQTIKKGTPHTLRLTKNQNSYEKSLREWHDDVELLKILQ